jgi:tagaturonate reductase
MRKEEKDVMILNKENLNRLESSKKLIIARTDSFDWPEKVLQFGTGVLLRGLPDYFIHKANYQGVFNGRIVIVKSTQKGSTDDFDSQNSLYTIGIRGFEDRRKIEENIICSAVSRVLTAQTEWNKILEIASSPDLQIIISNTTEKGIKLVKDNIHVSPPESFPGKLLAILYHRYKAFNGDESRGLIILPTELISDNAIVLKGIVYKLAEQNRMSKEFIQWLGTNTFCNTLVDRIVPGKPDENTLAGLEEQLGYRDELLIYAEPYRLWAIEGDERIRKILSFEQADQGVVITQDITPYKELKLRLLNGTHSLSCAAAFLSGFETVCEAMDDPGISHFIKRLIQADLATAIPYPVSPEAVLRFSGKVLDRFRNPFIRHQWITISSNYTMKLQMRVIPVLKHFYHEFQAVPEHIAFGFAAYLRFMKGENIDGGFFGFANGESYVIDDERAEYYSRLWSEHNIDELVKLSLANSQLWKSDLSQLQGFVNSVTNHLRNIEKTGVKDAIKLVN